MANNGLKATLQDANRGLRGTSRNETARRMPSLHSTPTLWEKISH